jgi:hypothetical protein
MKDTNWATWKKIVDVEANLPEGDMKHFLQDRMDYVRSLQRQADSMDEHNKNSIKERLRIDYIISVMREKIEKDIGLADTIEVDIDK